MDIEQQLQSLSQLGIQLRKGVDIADLIALYDRDHFETMPFRHLLYAMGREELSGGRGFASNQVWYLDTECIDGEGVYTAHLERLISMSEGLIVLENIQESVDTDFNETSVGFFLHGRAHQWEFFSLGDWLDPSLFTKFNQLLESENLPLRIFAGDLGGQDTLLVAIDVRSVGRLQELTGIVFS